MSEVQRLLRAVIDAGVSSAVGARIGTLGNPSTYEIIFDGTETTADLVAAQTVIDTIDLDSAAVVGDQLDREIDAEILLQAVAWATHDELVVLGSALTRNQFRANVRARYRQLRGVS